MFVLRVTHHCVITDIPGMVQEPSFFHDIGVLIIFPASFNALIHVAEGTA
jgi:hypothetical protein